MISEKKKRDSSNPKLEKMPPAEFMVAIVGAAIMPPVGLLSENHR